MREEKILLFNTDHVYKMEMANRGYPLPEDAIRKLEAYDRGEPYCFSWGEYVTKKEEAE